jgi:ATP phosphoribosyltransferase regulatory subunit
VIKAEATGRAGKQWPLHVFYIQTVLQDQVWGTGLPREVLQAGVENIGDDSLDRFPDLLKLSARVLSACGFESSIIYGDVRFLERLFSSIPEQLRSEMSASFHNKDTARIARLCEQGQLDAPTTEILKEVPLQFGGKEVLEQLKKLCISRPDLVEILDQASRIDGVLYDFSLVRDQSYYTGPVFEGYVKGMNERIVSGGVYDSLFQEFSGKSSPACGFAVQLSALASK